MKYSSILLVVVCLTGCMTQRVYDGPQLPRDEVAIISGDLRFTAGVPVSALLRQVDGRTLSLTENSVEVPSGKHSLLIDCKVQETGSTTRHSIEVDVYGGQHYRLVAETGPGLRECTSVALEAVN
ncbi:MAG: hypothetical protein ACJ8MH_15805 [Povalibacter sp.]